MFKRVTVPDTSTLYHLTEGLFPEEGWSLRIITPPPATHPHVVVVAGSRAEVLKEWNALGGGEAEHVDLLKFEAGT